MPQERAQLHFSIIATFKKQQEESQNLRMCFYLSF